jgi:iron complex transport system substrate-binding protein
MPAADDCMTFTDDLGRTVKIARPPRRIVCLCPSLTETLFDLGAGERVVGRTRYCVLPAVAVERVAIVGGTKDVDVERVRSLRPDLVIAEKEENPRDTVERLAEEWPAFVFDVTDFESALRAIAMLGRLTDSAAGPEEYIRRIRAAFAALQPLPPTRAAYLIWRNPYRAAGRGTFIHALLERCGFINICADSGGRYPLVEIETLRTLKPECLLLSSEPFPFDETHRRELAAQLLETRVVCVDGQMFGWYGTRMAAAATYLAALLPSFR